MTAGRRRPHGARVLVCGQLLAVAVLLAVSVLLAVLVLAIASTSAQAAPIPLIPTVDCAVANPDGTYTAYFGYQNTGTIPLFFGVGDSNAFFPGSPDEGQPTTFPVGNYPRVVAVTFLPSITPTFTWVLNGTAVSASASTPACYAGATGPVSDIEQTSATLDALIDPLSQATTYHFDWGTTTAYGQSTPTETVDQSDPLIVSQALTGLAPATTYHFRVVASNATVSTTGQDATFTTPPAPVAPPPPVLGALAVTVPASSPTASSATMNGVVNPQGESTSYSFEWGTTTAYGHVTPAQSLAGNDPQAVASTLTGLSPDTTYHYRLVATRGDLTTDGADVAFSTAVTPPPPPSPAEADVELLAGRYVGRGTVGRAIVYTMSVKNRGPATATTVVVRVMLAEGLRLGHVTLRLGHVTLRLGHVTLRLGHVTGGPSRCQGREVLTCRLARLAPGASATLVFRLTAVRAGRLRTAAYVAAAEPDPNAANNFLSLMTRFVIHHPPRFTG